jgi:Arc/MetJ-type ribon-helix-helix transcriptional regulator
MKVVVDIPELLLDEMRKAVSRGKYEDAKDFATVALENQVELEHSEDTAENVRT